MLICINKQVKKLSKYLLLREKYLNFCTFRGCCLFINGYIKSNCPLSIKKSSAFTIDTGRFVARRGPITVKWDKWMDEWMDGWKTLYLNRAFYQI